jgi:hypothetical protein
MYVITGSPTTLVDDGFLFISDQDDFENASIKLTEYWPAFKIVFLDEAERDADTCILIPAETEVDEAFLKILEQAGYEHCWYLSGQQVNLNQNHSQAVCW